MIVRLTKIEIDRKYSIAGRIVERRYVYAIVLWRWFRQPVYLRLNGDWYHAIIDGGQISVELTRAKYQATTFRENACDYHKLELGKKIVELIKTEPDRFVLG